MDKGHKTERKAEREDRLADALRRNLHRRKAQARERRQADSAQDEPGKAPDKA